MSENISEEPEGVADAPEDDDFAAEPAIELAYVAEQDTEDREHSETDHPIYNEPERESAIQRDGDQQLSPPEPVRHHATHITEISSPKAQSPPTRRISLPPPPRAIPPVPSTPGTTSSSSSRRSIPPTPVDAVPSPVEISPRSSLESPVSPAGRSARTSIPPPLVAAEESVSSEDVNELNITSQPLPPPVPTRRLSADLHSPRRSLPSLPPALPPTTEDETDTNRDEEPEHVPTDPSDYSEGDVEDAITDPEVDEQSTTTLPHVSSHCIVPIPNDNAFSQPQAEDPRESHKEDAEREVLDDSDVGEYPRCIFSVLDRY